MTELFFWVSPNGNCASRYAVNYGSKARQWFKKNNYGLCKISHSEAMSNVRIIRVVIESHG